MIRIDWTPGELRELRQAFGLDKPKRKATKKPTPRKSVQKRERTPAQIEATKRMLAAAAKKRKSRAAAAKKLSAAAKRGKAKKTLRASQR